jgi:hypothetical protein
VSVVLCWISSMKLTLPGELSAGVTRTSIARSTSSGPAVLSSLARVRVRAGSVRPGRYAYLTPEVVGPNPDVIVAQTNPVALAARAATGTIPIVWISVEPIGEGLVTSLARPGSNITAVSLYDAEFCAKRFQILKGAVRSAPLASRAGFFLLPPIGRRRKQRIGSGKSDLASWTLDPPAGS